MNSTKLFIALGVAVGIIIAVTAYLGEHQKAAPLATSEAVFEDALQPSAKS